MHTMTRTLGSTEVCRATGLSYRRLDYWTRTGIIPETLVLEDGDGSGSQRAFDPNIVTFINGYLTRLEDCPRCGAA